MNRDFMYLWHVAINAQVQSSDNGYSAFKYMYGAKKAAEEVPRIARLFAMERSNALPPTHQQCSISPVEPIANNELTCCLGVKCRECPALLAIDGIPCDDPTMIDTAKAWTCAIHIERSGGDAQNEGYILTTGDRMYWSNVYASLAAADSQEEEA